METVVGDTSHEPHICYEIMIIIINHKFVCARFSYDAGSCANAEGDQ